MLMKQVFKSLAGVQRRVAFENAHATSHFRYSSVLCDHVGNPIKEPTKFDFTRPHVYRIDRRKIT